MKKITISIILSISLLSFAGLHLWNIYEKRVFKEKLMYQLLAESCEISSRWEMFIHPDYTDRVVTPIYPDNEWTRNERAKLRKEYPLIVFKKNWYSNM